MRAGKLQECSILLVVSALLTLSGAGCSRRPGLAVENPWIRAAPPTTAAFAAYMTLRSTATSERVLVAARSPSFGAVTLHRTVVNGGMARMVEAKAVPIPPGGVVHFAPGGYHLMLAQPAAPVGVGEQFRVTLRFADGTEIPVDFEVRAAPSRGEP